VQAATAYNLVFPELALTTVVGAEVHLVMGHRETGLKEFLAALVVAVQVEQTQAVDLYLDYPETRLQAEEPEEAVKMLVPLVQMVDRV
jgi:hypothetical protein